MNKYLGLFIFALLTPLFGEVKPLEKSADMVYERDAGRNPSLSREGQGQDKKNVEKSLTVEESPPYQGGVLQAKDYSSLLGMKDFSDAALKLHFTLYAGYVKNSNAIVEKLQQMMAEGKEKSPEYGALKKQFGFEFNGMRLHEYYFENLTKNESVLDEKDALLKALIEQYGSFDAWKKEFIATGYTRGVGWVILSLDPQSGKLINMWVEEHQIGPLADVKPILVMDLFEHAYLPDFGIDREKYMGNFFNHIDWQRVSARFNKRQK